MGMPLRPYGSILAAWAGREADVPQAIHGAIEQVASTGEGLWLTACEWASAALYNGLSRYDEALVAAEKASVARREAARHIAVGAGRTGRSRSTQRPG